MEIKEIGLILDGGTICVTTDVGFYCVDSRVDTKTKGSVYKDYPEDDNSNKVQDQELIKKELLKAIDSFKIDDQRKFIQRLKSLLLGEEVDESIHPIFTYIKQNPASEEK